MQLFVLLLLCLCPAHVLPACVCAVRRHCPSCQDEPAAVETLQGSTGPGGKGESIAGGVVWVGAWTEGWRGLGQGGGGGALEDQDGGRGWR
jgi:hypothetical protein